jgi:hypothetical protein
MKESAGGEHAMKRTIFLALVFATAAGLDPVEGKILPPGKSRAQDIVSELKLIPRPGLFGYEEVPTPEFTPTALEPYKEDTVSLAELKKIVRKEPARYPLRAAVLEAITVLQESRQWQVHFFLRGPLGIPQKAFIRSEQLKLGADLFALEKVLEQGKKAGSERSREASRRWQAHYDFVLTALRARIVFGYEYSFALAQARREAMPGLFPGDAGWRLAPRPNLQIGEGKVKGLHKEAETGWQHIERAYPGTPWAFFARRERLSPHGLEWRPAQEPK